MDSKSDYFADYREYKCPACGYTYHEYYTKETQDKNPEKPFILAIGESFYRYDKDPMTGEDTTRRHGIYACPICGVLQIDVNHI